MIFTSIADLIREARNGRNQREFAHELEVSQASLSKYERGLVNPPACVIERCIHLVNPKEGPDVSADELAERIRIELRQADQASLRAALSRLIDGLILGKSSCGVA